MNLLHILSISLMSAKTVGVHEQLGVCPVHDWAFRS